MSFIRKILRDEHLIKKILLLVSIIMIITGPIVSFVFTYKDVTVENVSFTTNDGLTLQGSVYIPRGHSGNLPLVITHHGFTCNKEFMNFINVEVARAGYLVLSYNSRGHSTSSIDFNSYMTWAFNETDDVISSIEFMLNHNKYKTILDSGQVSTIGHSHGAYSVAIAANKTYTEPTSGLECYVNACIPIAPGRSWDDLFGRVLPFGNTAILQRITRLGNVLALTQQERDIRSPITYINQTYPTNLMIIIGTLDEFFTVEENMKLMSNGIYGNESMTGAIQSGVIYNNSGSVYSGTGYMRKILVEANIDHVMECFIPETMGHIVNFLDLTFSGTAQTRSYAVGGEIIIRQIGILAALAGVLLCFYPLGSYLTKYLKTRRDRWEYAESSRSLTSDIRRKQFFKYLAGCSFAFLLGGLSTLLLPTPWIPYLITDIIGGLGFFSGLFLMLVIFFLYKNEKDNYHVESIKDIGLNFGPRSLGSNLLLGTILGIFSAGVISIALLPVFWCFPRNPIGFLMVFGSFLPFVFSLEIISKGFIQNKFTHYGNKYKEWFYSAIVSGMIQGIAFNFVLAMIGTLINLPAYIVLGGLTSLIPMVGAIPTVAIYIIAGPLVFIPINVISGFIFQRTRNVLSTTLFLTITLSWLLSGMTPISFPL